MALKVVWSKRAKIRLNSIMNYLKAEWSTKINAEFLETVNSKVKTISLFPNIGEKTNKDKTLRQYLVTKHCYIIYEIGKTSIQIINIKNTRQKPNGN